MKTKRLLSAAPFKYQWRRDGVPIEGANKPTYVIQPEDIGCVIDRTADYMIVYEDDDNEQYQLDF